MYCALLAAFSSPVSLVSSVQLWTRDQCSVVPVPKPQQSFFDTLLLKAFTWFWEVRCCQTCWNQELSDAHTITNLTKDLLPTFCSLTVFNIWSYRGLCLVLYPAFLWFNIQLEAWFKVCLWSVGCVYALSVFTPPGKNLPQWDKELKLIKGSCKGSFFQQSTHSAVWKRASLMTL